MHSVQGMDKYLWNRLYVVFIISPLVSVATGVSDNGRPMFMSGNLMVCDGEQRVFTGSVWSWKRPREDNFLRNCCFVSQTNTSHLPVMNNFYARDPASVLCTYFLPQTKLNIIIYTTACNVLEGLKCLYHGLKLGHELE